METDQLKPDLIAVDFSVYGHEVTKQSHVDTAVERRGTLSFYERILRYAHIFRVLVKAHFLHQHGLPEAALNDYFDHDELESLDTEELFEVMTDKAGYEYVHVIRITRYLTVHISFYKVTLQNNIIMQKQNLKKMF